MVNFGVILLNILDVGTLYVEPPREQIVVLNGTVTFGSGSVYRANIFGGYSSQHLHVKCCSRLSSGVDYSQVRAAEVVAESGASIYLKVESTFLPGPQEQLNLMTFKSINGSFK